MRGIHRWPVIYAYTYISHNHSAKSNPVCSSIDVQVRTHVCGFNILGPRQNSSHSTGDIFKWNFLNEKVSISIIISSKSVSKGPINDKPPLAQIMAWCRSGDKPLSEPIMHDSLLYICVTRPQWVDTVYICLYLPIVLKNLRNLSCDDNTNVFLCY